MDKKPSSASSSPPAPSQRTRRPTRPPKRLSAADSFLDDDIKRAIQASLRTLQCPPPPPSDSGPEVYKDAPKSGQRSKRRRPTQKTPDETQETPHMATRKRKKDQLRLKTPISLDESLSPRPNAVSPQGSPGRPVPPKQRTNYIGVRQSGNRYTAYIRIRDKERFIGWFPTSIEAAKAYDEMAIQLFKDKAQTNFMKKDDGSLPVFGFGLTESKKGDSSKQSSDASKIKRLLTASSASKRQNFKSNKKKKYVTSMKNA